MEANSGGQRRQHSQGAGRTRRGPGHGIPPLLALCVLWLALGAVSPAHARAAAPGQQPRSCGSGGARSTGSRAAEAAPAKSAGADITLNIAQGGPGSRIIAQGSGWPAGAQVVIQQEQSGQVIASTRATTLTVAADGTFVAPPFGALGPTCGFDPTPGTVLQIVGHSAADTSLTASATFTYVSAPPALAPAAGVVTSSATALPVVGANWDAGTLVTLWTAPPWPATPATPSATGNAPDLWQPPADVPSVQVRADGQGAFSARVPLPARSLPPRPGTDIQVAASASSPRYGTLATSLPGPIQIQPPIAPSLSLDRGGGPAGSAILVAGDHWWPGDSVRIAYCRNALRQCNPNSTQDLGTATVDGAGHFSARVNLPSNARTGPITIEAYVGDGFSGPYLVAQPFQVVAATLPAAPAQPGSWPAWGIAALVIGLAVLAVIAVAGWLFARRTRRA